MWRRRRRGCEGRRPRLKQRRRRFPISYHGNSMTTPQSYAPTLLRRLGFFSAAALVISNMIGTGIFATTGFMAGDLGSASWILAAWFVGALFAAAGAVSY